MQGGPARVRRCVLVLALAAPHVFSNFSGLVMGGRYNKNTTHAETLRRRASWFKHSGPKKTIEHKQQCLPRPESTDNGGHERDRGNQEKHFFAHWSACHSLGLVQSVQRHQPPTRSLMCSATANTKSDLPVVPVACSSNQRQSPSTCGAHGHQPPTSLVDFVLAVADSHPTPILFDVWCHLQKLVTQTLIGMWCYHRSASNTEKILPNRNLLTIASGADSTHSSKNRFIHRSPVDQGGTPSCGSLGKRAKTGSKSLEVWDWQAPDHTESRNSRERGPCENQSHRLQVAEGATGDETTRRRA